MAVIVIVFVGIVIHSTPLALSLPSQGSWRGPGVGGEAFYFKMFTSMRLNGNMKPRSFSS